MKESKRIVPFPVFQGHCGERNFMYAGRPGAFNVSCKLPGGPQKCNPDVCPIWNSVRVENVPQPDMSLRDINLKLRNEGSKPQQGRALKRETYRPVLARVVPPALDNNEKKVEIDMCGGPL